MHEGSAMEIAILRRVMESSVNMKLTLDALGLYLASFLAFTRSRPLLPSPKLLFEISKRIRDDSTQSPLSDIEG